MAITAFQLVDNQTFLPADISAGSIFISPEQVNGVGSDLSTGIQVVVDYHDLQSTPVGTGLQAIVEGKSPQGQFYTVARQFTEFNKVGTQERRQIMMFQDLDMLDQGKPDMVAFGAELIEQISRQQGIMPSIWRVRVGIRDPLSSFVSLRMSIYGHRFNQLTNFRGILVDTDGPGTLVTTEVE